MVKDIKILEVIVVFYPDLLLSLEHMQEMLPLIFRTHDPYADPPCFRFRASCRLEGKLKTLDRWIDFCIV